MKTKTFDCVEMMHRGALRIHEEVKDMTVEEELAYWRKQQVDAAEELRQARQAHPVKE